MTKGGSSLHISGVQKTSLVDFPGSICDTVFFAGCNLRCPYCHNPSLVISSGVLPGLAANEVLAGLSRRAHLLDGVCISGGEPTLQPAQGLVEFFAEIKQLGLSIKLDTNGTKPQVLERLVVGQLVDYVAMDVKAPLERYSQVCRVPVDTGAVQESAALLLTGVVDYEFRTTSPRSLLSQQDFTSIGQWLQGAKRYALQAYQSGMTLDPSFVSDEQGSEQWLLSMRTRLLAYFSEVQVRGLRTVVAVG